MKSLSKHVLCATVALLAPVGAAWAQPAAPATTEAKWSVEEITVTARKREERLLDVPMSISALAGETMETSGVKTIDQISSLVPGIAFEASGAGQSSLTIRGSSTRSTGQTESPIGSFVDGIYDSRPAAVLKTPVDIERIEVIKGPQGTVLGRNTIAGALSIITKDPTDTFEGSISGEVGGSATPGDMLWNLRGVISGPISETLSGRLVAAHDYRKGYILDRVSGVRGGSHDADMIRGKLLWEPTDKLSIKFSAEYNEENRPRVDCIQYGAGKSLGSNPATPASAITFCNTGDDIWTSSRSDVQPTSIVTAEIFVLTVDYETPIGTLTSLTGHKFGTWETLSNTDGTQYVMANGIQSDKATNFSQEFRLVGEADRWTWLAGVYYYHEDSLAGLASITGPQAAIYATGARGSDRHTAQTLKAYSAFGQVSYDVTDQLTVTAGGRYSKDEKDSVIDLVTYTATGKTGFTVARVGEWDSFDPSISLNYNITDDALVYVSYASGYRAGGFNDGATAAASSSSLAYRPEQLGAYEAGVKGLFLDRRLRATASVFLNDYEDLLVNTSFRDPVTGGIFTTQVNASASKVTGLEFDTNYQLNDAFRVFLAYTFLDGKVDEFTPAVSTSPNFKGLPLPKMSNHAWVMGVSYAADLGPGHLTGQISLRYRSEYPNTLNSAIDPSTGQPALDWTQSYYVADANVGYVVNDWSFNAYIRNIANEDYIPTIISSSATNYPLAVPAEPRTFGIQITRNF
jgi:iron complex outermembrane receptor protein